ncbi:cell division protein FtsZ [Helicobacter sp. 23-1045]
MQVEITEMQNRSKVRISVVGVGGGGCNTINHIIKHGINDEIKLISLNTDEEALSKVSAHSKLKLGEKTTDGLGAGMCPEIGRKSAEESYESIIEEIKGSHIVLIATGLGGGTGTGASPIVAKAAKEVGALTIAVVTKPFKHEGSLRARLADEGLKEIKKEVDSFIVIPNEKLLSIIDKSLGFKNCLKIVDDVMAQAVKGIASFVLHNSGDGINIDFADLNTVMQFKGLGLIGIGEKEGEDSAVEAVKEAIESPLLDNISINGARGAIVYYELNEDYPMHKVNEANEIIESAIDREANVKFGYKWNNELHPSQIKVTLVFTGFEKELIHSPQEIAPVDKFPQMTQIKIAVGGGTRNTAVNFDDIDRPTFLRAQQD